MKKIIQLRIHRGETHYVAECMDLPVVTQAKSLDELAENIKEAIALHLEDEDLSELDLDPEFSILASFEIEPLIHVEA
jgi:predicted RNase H-like HicB family nuclease